MGVIALEATRRVEHNGADKSYVVQLGKVFHAKFRGSQEMFDYF